MDRVVNDTMAENRLRRMGQGEPSSPNHPGTQVGDIGQAVDGELVRQATSDAMAIAEVARKMAETINVMATDKAAMIGITSKAAEMSCENTRLRRLLDGAREAAKTAEWRLVSAQDKLASAAAANAELDALCQRIADQASTLADTLRDEKLRRKDKAIARLVHSISCARKHLPADSWLVKDIEEALALAMKAYDEPLMNVRTGDDGGNAAKAARPADRPNTSGMAGPGVAKIDRGDAASDGEMLARVRELVAKEEGKAMANIMAKVEERLETFAGMAAAPVKGGKPDLNAPTKFVGVTNGY